MDEFVMSGSKQPDFLQPLLDLMQRNADRQSERMDAFEKKLDTNTSTTQQVLEQAKETNGRMTRAERAISRLETKKGKKLELPPNVIYLIALGAVILLAVVATLLHINLSNLL